MGAAPKKAIGWREWLALPELGIPAIKAKIDTGARSSVLHAFDVKVVELDGVHHVRFKVHPLQRNSRETVAVSRPFRGQRRVTSSSGHSTLRPVILTTVRLLGREWPIELTLTNRDDMGFRMLLGRQAVRDFFVVDPGASYLGGKPKRNTKKVKKKKPTKKPSAAKKKQKKTGVSRTPTHKNQAEEE